MNALHFAKRDCVEINIEAKAILTNEIRRLNHGRKINKKAVTNTN